MMNSPDNLSDSTLLLQIADNGELAFEQFYERYKRLVFSLALHILRDSNAAEEITLDVFNKVWLQASGYHSDRASVKTWLMTIARHAAIDQLRRRSSRHDQDQARWDVEALETLPSTDNVERNVADRERHQQVVSAIAQLPVEQQKVLALAYFNGSSHSEIAAKLNQPLGTIKSRIRNALLQLRETLNQEP